MNSYKISSQVVQYCIKNFHTIDFSKNRKYLCKQIFQDCKQTSTYQTAKWHETKTRNLDRALILYMEAAVKGEKVNSCIKDFASVLHQGGYTYQAINFLKEMKTYYRGDCQKYQKLINNLSSQLCPTGKHEYKFILIDLVDLRILDPELQIPIMFSNYSRIKSIKQYQDLSFVNSTQNGKYIVLQFDSFSAAKKTLQTFNQSEWFGVNKFWMDCQYNIVAQAINGRTDFEHGFLMNKGHIQKIDGKNVNQSTKKFQRPNFGTSLRISGLQLKNQQSMYLIKYYNH